MPTSQPGSPLDTPDSDTDWMRGPAPGRAMLDAPVKRDGGRDGGRDGEGWLVDRLGAEFTVLMFADRDVPIAGLPPEAAGICIAGDGLARQRYDARAGTTYLVRPDRYIAARWRRFDSAAIAAAIRRATGNG